MLSDIKSGNAKEDGGEFRYWFVGRIEKWCREKNVPFDVEKFGIRNTDDIEIKWGIYKKGDVRNVWARCSGMTALSILIRGDCIFSFREKGDNSSITEVKLENEGDYVIWRENVEHTWEIFRDSEFLTLRWVQHPVAARK
jgi:hypothetical protein